MVLYLSSSYQLGILTTYIKKVEQIKISLYYYFRTVCHSIIIGGNESSEPATTVSGSGGSTAQSNGRVGNSPQCLGKEVV